MTVQEIRLLTGTVRVKEGEKAQERKRERWG